ncbi:Kiwa anti-phage protein KwaB-like domain-containing protein [Paraburkholderia sediminicola]|uniref:Kiwa anti-phage protein KwaB-like domain-containing protein n=1 Tax=Paraburkholderia sediminicola TaxID=458836 RepID=UPI0038B71A77
MNLFALTSSPGARIVRFPLTQELQDEIKTVFEEQHKAFTADIVETVEFDGRYRPDQGELLVIKNFADVDGLATAVKNPLAVELFDPNAHSLETVKAFFTGNPDGGEQVLIQVFERRRLIATKNVAIFFSGNTFQRMSDAGLTLDNKLLAILDGNDLKFQSFHYVRRVFDVEDHFKEATSAEVKAFANHDKLAAEDPAAFEAGANSLVRRKIALILQSGVLDNFTAEQIVATAQSFKLEIKTTKGGKIALPSNGTELRRLLRFLDEDYYESPLSQTHFVSNSKRVAD